MRFVRNGIGALLLVPLLATSGTVQAQSAKLEEAAGLAGLAMFMESGAVGMILAVVDGDDQIVVVNKIDFGMYAGLVEGANEPIASLAPQ
jgi:hypothetical protein